MTVQKIYGEGLLAESLFDASGKVFSPGNPPAPTPGRAQFAAGSFVGDASSNRLIALPFTPRLVLLAARGGFSRFTVSPLTQTAGALGLQFTASAGTTATVDSIRPRLTTGGFVVDSNTQNQNAIIFDYVAFG